MAMVALHLPIDFERRETTRPFGHSSNLASNAAHSIRSKTESRLAASELVDDLKLKGIQRAVFEKIVHDSLNGAGDSDWEYLRRECWPLRRDGKVDETVTRGGVANAVEHVQEKVVAW